MLGRMIKRKKEREKKKKREREKNAPPPVCYARFLRGEEGWVGGRGLEILRAWKRQYARGKIVISIREINYHRGARNAEVTNVIKGSFSGCEIMANYH